MTDPSRLWSPRERKCLSLLQSKSRHTKLALLQIHAFILRNALQSNLNLITKLITSLSSSGATRHARQVFDQLPQKSDAFLCNTMLKSHLISGEFPETIALYAGLRRNQGFVPDNYTFSTMAKSCGLNNLIWDGMGIHGQVVRYGYESNLYVATALVDMYGKMGRMILAQKVFHEMPVRSPVSWTALVTGYIRNGEMGIARSVFDAMPTDEKDAAAYNVMIDGHVKLGEMEEAKALFDAAPEKNVVSWTTMIDGYCSNGDVEEARALFDSMLERNLYSWNAMIGGYSANKQPHEALVLFLQLLRGGAFEPDDVTVVSILPAVSELGALDVGNWVCEFVKRKNLDRSANVSTAMVDMYAKCGEIGRARETFKEAKVRKTCTWNALINGLALNGRANEALGVFLEMQTKGFKPDEITMLGVLSACNHGGLVDKGRRWFDKMVDFGLTPKIEHYGCLVDLLGRAGCVEEAERLIDQMPYEANGIILSSLLFACGYVKDVTRAEKVVKRVIDLDPGNDGNYIMLRNLYASERRWRDVERIKKLMLANGAKKEAGCSTIEIDNRVLEFVAGNDVHPSLGVTHAVLAQLRHHLKTMDSLFDVEFQV